MIRFTWKGVEVEAKKTDTGWIGPPDCPLEKFESEGQAAERLRGAVVDDKPETGGK